MTAKYSNYWVICSKWQNGRLCGLYLNNQRKDYATSLSEKKNQRQCVLLF